jgi:DNA modification methylase
MIGTPVECSLWLVEYRHDNPDPKKEPPARTREQSFDENRNVGGVCGRCGSRKRRALPTERPPYVSEILITQSTEIGELVCDPFMGSGSVGVAAKRSGRRFAGCDIKQSAVEFVRERLK